MGKVTDLGDINDKCVRQDANVPDSTAIKLGRYTCHRVCVESSVLNQIRRHPAGPARGRAGGTLQACANASFAIIRFAAA